MPSATVAPRIPLIAGTLRPAGVLTFDEAVDACADNLREIRTDASPVQVAEGREWYRDNGEMIAELAIDASVTHWQACGVFAAFSQNSTWKANVTMAGNYLFGHRAGMKSVLAECDDIMNGAGPDRLIGKSGQSKRPDFWRNLAGEDAFVTCDRHHIRAAFGREGVANSPLVREIVTAATTIVAAEHRETPAQCQAVIWCAVRGDGK